MNRTEIIRKIDEVVTNYCEGCFVKTQLRKDFGKTHAHRFCIQSCTVGEKVQNLGEKLSQ
ncbi:zinc-finger domain-containing protein [Bacillus coahuilensis]|uniref:zinc-finger domain-containing protein n=1 Tax=Bacillus coahuilensis TaxID=408580 RepID=UPI0009D72185|nr:zinc-finger domain-containing protein [Bacillus coahuilensis]